MRSAIAPPREGALLFDRYSLVGPRPDRGLGEAWRADDIAAGRAERLVKFYPLAQRGDHDVEARLARLRAVSAPGLATVLSGGVWQGAVALVYEACPGRSLAHWLEGWRTTQTRPTPGTAKMLFLHLCSVVHEAHGKGLAHERLNPASVIITSVKAPRPLVIFDAGVAAFLSGEDQAACTSYLGPNAFEPLRKGAAADASRGDLFALGVILAELLTLRPTPREGSRETWEQLARSASKKGLASLAARPDEVSADLWGLVARLLLGRNDAEFSSASKIRQAARKAWESEGARDDTSESLREAPLPAEPSPRASLAAASDSASAVAWRAPPPSPGPLLAPASSTTTAPPPTTQGPGAAARPATAPSGFEPEPTVALDTLIDAGHGSAALARAQVLERAAPAASGAVKPSTGGETILVGDLQHAGLFPGGDGPVNAANTLLMMPGPASPPDPSAVFPFQQVDASDPFAAVWQKKGGTLAVDEALPGAAQRPSFASYGTIITGPASRPSFSPGDGTGTISMANGGAPPAAGPASFAPPAPHTQGGPRQQAVSTPGDVSGRALQPAATSHGARSWWLKFGLAMVVGGVALGALIVALLRVG